MRMLPLAVVVVLVPIATGCGEEYLMSVPDEDQAPAAALSGTSVAQARDGRLPLTGHGEGLFAPVLDATGNPVPCDAFEGGFLMHLEGSGVMSHLGRITISTTHCASPDRRYNDGFAVYTGASGDALHATYHQLGAPEDPAMETIIGGTGRFRNATGEVQVSVVPTIEFDEHGMPLFPGHFTVSYEGWISYRADPGRGGE